MWTTLLLSFFAITTGYIASAFPLQDFKRMKLGGSKFKLRPFVSSDEIVTSIPDDYIYFPPEVGSEIYIGSFVSLIPIIWATYEFGSRLL